LIQQELAQQVLVEQEVQQELILLLETVAEAVAEARTNIVTVIHPTTAVMLGTRQVEVAVELLLVREVLVVAVVLKTVLVVVLLQVVNTVGHIVKQQDTIMFVTKETREARVVI
jgi:hypothetical protein